MTDPPSHTVPSSLSALKEPFLRKQNWMDSTTHSSYHCSSSTNTLCKGPSCYVCMHRVHKNRKGSRHSREMDWIDMRAIFGWGGGGIEKRSSYLSFSSCICVRVCVFAWTSIPSRKCLHVCMPGRMHYHNNAKKIWVDGGMKMGMPACLGLRSNKHFFQSHVNVTGRKVCWKTKIPKHSSRKVSPTSLVKSVRPNRFFTPL